MTQGKKKGPVPYHLVSPGFEAIYTGEKASSDTGKAELITTITADSELNEIRRWPVVSWTWPGQEEDWDEDVRYINAMQGKLGDLDNSIRQIRAHIASLVPCDSGFPVTVDELLNAIGRGKLNEPSLRNGCWCPGMWWEQRTTQPHHMESMKLISSVLKHYLEGENDARLIGKYPAASGFIRRTLAWLGPSSKLAEYQMLLLKRILLTIDSFAVSSDTQPRDQFSDPQMAWMEAQVDDLFGEGGQGSRLDEEIASKAGLPTIHPQWKSEYRQNLEQLDQPAKELYRTCCAVASGVHTLSDCHHNTFRYIESWIHGIGTGQLRIPTRRTASESGRLGRSLFGYVLGLNKWLAGEPMQFLLLDLGHTDLGFDPKNEILRVYANLGADRTPVKKWLAACLWYNLMNAPIGGNPGGLVRHEKLLERATSAGISLRDWRDSATK